VKYEPVSHQSFHARLICWFFGEREDALLRVNPSGDISTVLFSKSKFGPLLFSFFTPYFYDPRAATISVSSHSLISEDLTMPVLCYYVRRTEMLEKTEKALKKRV